MRLKALKLRNFRAYRGEVVVPVDEDVTTLVGKNDSGKSSILDALAIFFGSPLVKIDQEDLCVRSDDHEIRIGCVFDELPEGLTLDAGSETDLESEYLLNRDGNLEIHKIYDCSKKSLRPKVVAMANHPTAEGISDLLLKKNNELKALLKSREIPAEGVDQRSNPAMRRAIWAAAEDLAQDELEIELNKEDAKAVWDQIERLLPAFALFRADRPSTDEDAEVQDPMKVAVKQAIADLNVELSEIEEKVRQATLDVAGRTLKKLEEIEPGVAKDLMPVFRTDPKWEGIFKLALSTEDEIPVNKRGSGVRRLILLAFFRAEAERRREEGGKARVIYAIEEPETSQHPANQRAVIEALKELGDSDDCQVLLTTHVPGLAELVPVASIRHVQIADDGLRRVETGADEILNTVAEDLGVIPDHRVRGFVCVEGPHDVSFLQSVARLLVASGIDEALDLEADPRIVVLPLGGSTLRDWVNDRYLRPLGRPEIHIYDRDREDPPKYESDVEAVNGRGDGSSAFLTAKAEAENYLHQDAIQAVLGIEVEVTDDNDVPLEVARAAHEVSESQKGWDDLPAEKQRKKKSRAKQRLNREVAQALTIEMLRERGALDEIREWFSAMKTLCE